MDIYQPDDYKTCDVTLISSKLFDYDIKEQCGFEIDIQQLHNDLQLLCLGQGVPSTWSKVQMKDQQLCYEEELFPGNTEYDRVKMEFQRSGGSRSIVKVCN